MTAKSTSEIDSDVWLLVSELWRILRYKHGSHAAKLQAAQYLQEWLSKRSVKDERFRPQVR